MFHLDHSGATVNQLLRRAAAAAALRRERNSSHDDLTTLKRQRSDNGLSGNNNSPDVMNNMPQVNAADYSTIKHNNNNTPPMKDAERPENYSIESKCILFATHFIRIQIEQYIFLLIKSYFTDVNILSNNNTSNGNGLSVSSIDKDSLTPSPPNRLNDDVKSEPMDMALGNHNLPSDEQSNDSIGEHESKYLGGNDGKGSLR